MKSQIPLEETKTATVLTGIIVKGRKLLASALALVPPGILTFYCLKYTADIPYFDQWDFVPFLEKSYNGTLGLADFWAQHNEHRIIFSRAILLVLARLTSWNILAETLGNIVMAIAIFALLVYQTNRTFKKLDIAGVNWLIPVISIVVFSLNQWENWTWGWQIVIFLNTLVVVAGTVILANRPFSWLKLAAAIGLGVMSSYSLANGILYWFINLAVLFLVCRNDRRTLRISLALWITAGTLTTLSYLYDYTQPERHPSLFVIFQQPLSYAGYVLAYLGSQLRILDNVWSAALAGGLGLLLQAYLIWALLRRGLKLELLLPYLAISLYAIGSALITGLGRVGFGEVQAVTPRYITTSYLFWIANLVFLYLLILTRNSQPVTRDLTPSRGNPQLATRNPQLATRNSQPATNSYLAAIIIIFALIGYSSFRARIPLAQRYDQLAAIRTNLIATGTGEPDPQSLSGLYSVKSQAVKDGLKILKKRHLSIYRD